MKPIPVQINRIGNQLKKVFAYGDSEEKLSLLKVMQYHLEFNKFALIEAKKEAVRNQLEQSKETIGRLEQRLADLEKEGNPFHAFKEDDALPSNKEVPSSSALKGSHSVTVGGGVPVKDILGPRSLWIALR